MVYNMKYVMLFKIGLDTLVSKNLVLHVFFAHNYAKIKIDFCDSLPLEKTLTFLTILILVK